MGNGVPAQRKPPKIGLAGCSLRAHHQAGLLPTPEDYLRKASSLGFDGILLDTSLLPRPDQRRSIGQLKSLAEDLGLYLDVGTGMNLHEAARDGQIAAIFEMALELESPVVKSVLQAPYIRFKQRWTREDAERNVRETTESVLRIEHAARACGVRVALENHIDFRAAALRTIRMALASQDRSPPRDLEERLIQEKNYLIESARALRTIFSSPSIKSHEGIRTCCPTH